MEKDELKKVFHALFNKINNIFTAASSNKIFLEEDDLDKLSVEELKGRISELLETLSLIEKNVIFLNQSLQGVYETLKKESNSPV